MYCRNCGNKLLPNVEICEGCGVKPPKGEQFCSSCGVEVLPLAETCIKCGAALGKPPRPKIKTVAVLLALFLGPWTWLYTYRENTWKFWLGAVISVPSLIIFSVGVIPHNEIEFDANGNFIGNGGFRFSNQIMVPVMLVVLVVWIWAVADVCLKHQDWYLTYNWTAPPGKVKKSRK
jgi:hypothetical protein